MARATLNGTIIAESDKTVMVEGNHYFPADSVNRELLQESAKRTICGWKGEASYFDIVVDGKVNANAAWVYVSPKDAAAEIKDHLAFWGAVKVEG